MAQDSTILLVEDDLMNQKVLRYLIEAKGMKCQIVGNGIDAIEALKEPNSYKIILMDLLMPILNGLEATRAIRAAGYQIPIIALTACVMTGDRERCLASGMNAFLSKPFSKEQFDEVVDPWMKGPAEV